jgi:hypothetical protein
VFIVRTNVFFGDRVSMLVGKCGFRAEFSGVTTYFVADIPSESIFAGS